MPLEAIIWKEKRLKILDQLLLPMESKYMSVNNVDEGFKVINKMQVRGAPAIAIVGCLSLATELNQTPFTSKSELQTWIADKLEYLVLARPTAVNMKNAAENLLKKTDILLENETSVDEVKAQIIKYCEDMLKEDVDTNKAIGELGASAILATSSKKVQLLTHCNTGSLATAGYGTALGVIRSVHAKNMLEHAFCTETRPYHQGSRLTAYELGYENIPGTLICDNMAAALMNTQKIDAIVVGADRVTRNGDTANKIGTYQLAVVAKHHDVPFYVCAPSTSIDVKLETGDEIPIEERPHSEMKEIAGIAIAAPDTVCWNPAFDVTPAELITGGIVTEKGVFKPHELMNTFLC